MLPVLTGPTHQELLQTKDWMAHLVGHRICDPGVTGSNHILTDIFFKLFISKSIESSILQHS